MAKSVIPNSILNINVIEVCEDGSIVSQPVVAWCCSYSDSGFVHLTPVCADMLSSAWFLEYPTGYYPRWLVPDYQSFGSIEEAIEYIRDREEEKSQRR